MPEVCVDLYALEAAKQRQNRVITDYVTPDTLVLLAALLIVANVVLICVYRQCVKKEMDKHGVAVS